MAHGKVQEVLSLRQKRADVRTDDFILQNWAGILENLGSLVENGSGIVHPSISITTFNFLVSSAHSISGEVLFLGLKIT